jgi:hyperosmotically inducible protein
MSKKLMGLVLGVSFTGLLLGCEGTSNYNSTANANLANANANANTNANTNANANANANTRRRTVNANITREEYEKDKGSFAEEAKELGRTIGTGAEDGWLWTKTRAVLATADDLRDSTINVDVDNGVVTLSGSVANAAQKTKAGQVAKGVEGVKNVKNNLTVAPSS